MTNKADQKYWDKYYSGFEFQIAPVIHPIRQLIEQYIPETNCKTCIEIGCYPGALLAVFGELGYKLYGIDLYEKIDILPKWLESQNYNVGEFWKDDFLKFNPGHKFAVVSSFGFLEHFTNWEEILLKHLELVEDGGHIIIEAPNFIGAFQHFLHKNFDKKNYDHHHIPAMNNDNWSEI
jgi:2-polyprenyl-3-methyl-5-hydroxy-6-metoxy-1,4-benzoquinol methylase